MLMTALVLACIGGGGALKPDSVEVQGQTSGSYDYGRGQYNGSYNGTATGVRREGYADQVDLEIDGNEGRIRLPRSTLPVIRGGENGWFQLRNIEVSERTITATAAVNLINRPRIHIDRVTGTIRITGRNGDFSGQCEAIDPSAERRF